MYPEPDFEQSEEHDNEQLSSSFVPAAHRQATEREAVEQTVSDEQPVAWPPRGDTPLIEFRSELPLLSLGKVTADSPGNSPFSGS